MTIFLLPGELQVHMLSFLRAFDLSHVQHTCRFYNDPVLIHKVVTHQADYVYTRAYVVDPRTTSTTTSTTTTTTITTTTMVTPSAKTLAAPEKENEEEMMNGPLYTLEDLRHMELTVVARILSTPEPKTGFYISKSWIKKTLLWLEKVHEDEQDAAARRHHHHPSANKKKLSKKQLRQRSRRLSDVSPPWPNVNSDLLCPHANLQRCGTKSARCRRRLLDKQAWKILKKLYPESSQLESVQGECLQCWVETETTKRTEHAMAEQRKLERKQPLTNPLVRRFYTRTRGVPTHCLQQPQQQGVGGVVAVGGGTTATTGTARVTGTEADKEELKGEEKVAKRGDEEACDDDDDDNDDDDDCDDDDTDAHQKPKARVVMTKAMPRSRPSKTTSNCPLPLLPGTYHLLPRAWCHQWRKYIKTGEGSLPLPPDASALLCHAHRLPLLPPHLEAYIYGETSQLLTSITTSLSTTPPPPPPRWCEEVTIGSSSVAAASSSRTVSPVVVGIRPALDPTAVQALLSAGLSPAELAVQQRAMMQLEQQRRQVPIPPPPRAATATAAAATPLSSQALNDLLDSENHVVVEIVPDDEWRALQETKSWPQQHHFSVSFTVADDDDDEQEQDEGMCRRRHISFSTLPCRDCDASGKASSSNLCLKTRARGLAHHNNSNKRNSNNPQQQPQSGKKTLQKGDHQKALTLTLEY
jgi:hypothetical protein